ncbi:protein FAM216B [Sarcophilus harrisii]|uniref:protein FAM216B n=1 Tax=Sarcophilus harrisii TaxID=9305 RepID=UPI000273AFEB|nr:protein FAM216B [Sarcophilus harrisii]
MEFKTNFTGKVTFTTSDRKNMNQSKKKKVEARRRPAKSPGKSPGKSPEKNTDKEIQLNSGKPVPSSRYNPAMLKGLNPGQKKYLKGMMKIYDAKPQWKGLKKQYLIGLCYKHALGYIDKKNAMSFIAVMDGYIRNGPFTGKSKK